MANGTLDELNCAFKRRRMEATASGQGLMSFKTATPDCGRRSFRCSSTGAHHRPGANTV
jgi:hypothetical protein